MVPRVGKLTPLGRKMYNVLLLLTQQQLPAVQPRNGLTGIDAGHLFRAPLSSVVEPAITGDSDPKTVAKKYLTEMRRVEVDWEAPDESSPVIWSSMSLLSQAKLEKQNGSIWVCWAFPPDLLLALADPERYTSIELLANMAALKRYASIALYEICARYKNNPSGVTSNNTPDWWVDALSNAPAPVDPKTGQKKRREWRKVKNEAVIDAIQEINDKTDLTIELIEHKAGKAVASVQFAVRRKKAPSHDAVLSENVALIAARLDISLSQLAQLVKTGRFSEGAILLGLTKLEARVKAQDLDPIENRMAYLRTVLEDDQRYLRSEDEPPRPEQPATIKAVEEGEAKASWMQNRIADLKKELLALPEAQQMEYASVAAEELKNIGMNQTTLRRFKMGNWKSGVLLSRVVEVYARTIYGPGWNQEPAINPVPGVVEG